MRLHALYALLLKKSEEIVFGFASLLTCQFAGKPLELLGARVTERIDSMTDAVYQTCAVVCLLVKDAVQISVNLVTEVQS